MPRSACSSVSSCRSRTSRPRRRLSWLSLNVLLNIVAASVIALYFDTLHAAIALAVFLPIVSDLGGCSGNQAVAVSMRKLSLGIVKPFEAPGVWRQEIQVGVPNGIALGLLPGLAAWVCKGNPWLGVGATLAIDTVVAVSLAGTVPLLLEAPGSRSGVCCEPNHPDSGKGRRTLPAHPARPAPLRDVHPGVGTQGGSRMR